MVWNKGKHLSEEHKEKDRLSHLGTHHSEATKKKMSEAHKGKHFSDEHKRKIGVASKGRLHSEESNEKNRLAHLGTHHSDETKKKISENHAKYWKGKNRSKETKQKLREARKHQILPRHHTKPELKFEEICKKYNLPYKYVGDGKFWIESINPDFVESNGKKIAVEIFGDYWHSPLLNPKLRKNMTLPYREKTLKKYGWKLIVFWEDELKSENAEAIVMNRTMNFRGK